MRLRSHSLWDQTILILATGLGIGFVPVMPGTFGTLLGLPLAWGLDRSGWPRLRVRFTEVIASRTRDEWAETFAGTDACVTPVLHFGEAAVDPHITARETVITLDGIPQAAPAPRFSRTPAATPSPPPVPGRDTRAVLADWDA